MKSSNLIAFSLQPNSLGSAFSLQPNSLSGGSSRRGFTLVEMLVVVVIIGVLAAAGLSIYSQARTAAWKQKTRDTARQIALAYYHRLMDDGVFPAVPIPAAPQPFTGKLVFQTLTVNISALNSNRNTVVNSDYGKIDAVTNFVYLDQTADERAGGENCTTNGMKDHWGHFFYVQVDPNYQAKVFSPLDGTTVINANVLVWSIGPYPGNPTNSYCMAWQ